MAMDASVEFTLINVSVYRDGTIHRAPYDPPPLPVCPSPSSPDAVATDDFTLNAGHGTSLRLFKPPSSHKLPLLLYFHGGGFLTGSSSLPPDHSFLCKLAAHSRTLIISVDYRLAPEHPLPAAYDDAVEALLWLRNSTSLGELAPHPWLSRYADFSNCFLGGDSAGANIAHHVAMWMAMGSGLERAPIDLGFGAASPLPTTKVVAGALVMEGLCVRGVILIHPFFTCGADTILEREAKVWKLGGVNPEHPFANPLSSSAPSLADVALSPRILVAVASEDMFAARGLAYHQALVRAGKDAKLFISQDEGHVFHMHRGDSKNVPLFLDELRDFINPQ